MEFHLSRKARARYGAADLLFGYAGNVVFANVAASRDLAARVNAVRAQESAGVVPPGHVMHGASLFAMGLIDELSHALVAKYRQTLDPEVLPEALRWFAAQVETPAMQRLLLQFADRFPTVAVYRGELTAAEWLTGETDGLPNAEIAFEEMMMLWLANLNPAFAPFREFFDDTELVGSTVYPGVTAQLDAYFATRPVADSRQGTLMDVLRAPMLASPDSLTGQLEFIREQWVEHLGEELRKVVLAIDVVKEEDVAIWMQFHPASAAKRHGEAPRAGWGAEGFEGDEFVGFGGTWYVDQTGARRWREAIRDPDGQPEQPTVHEYEAFSPDQAWMPTVVLVAKSTYVWLEQLSKKYGHHIHRLDQIPEEELGVLADRGLNGLWLIGLWERSIASQTIKRMRGQADAVASAYSVADYRIAEDLGGEAAYRVLRDKAAARGIRLASDMVPNHMGIDSTWVMEHPEWFLAVPQSPFPVYSFNGPDLSNDSRVEIKIEDHYFDQTDAAVVFQRREPATGRTDFMYHGNDGTTFAWNDTAQLDYSKAVVREQVMQTILAVARLFPIIRFDAAMTLAKKHVQRLWFPIPGVGGSIPSRAEHAISNAEFDTLMPNEFWREVVDRVAVEVPGTLLLAEAFWLLEGYFVRTLGMHRVYNSAFMNMLRDEENAKYRSYLKKTIEFDPDILKRYVNFMSNPDERTAIDQFGSGDRYFGVCTVLATIPGLPMFGHGQIEAFTEKYGMEYKRARFDEWPDEDLVARHQREIAPLLKNRRLYAESEHFVLYDFATSDGSVDENVFAYSNRLGGERAIILFNNRFGETRGTIHVSVESMDKGSGELRTRQLTEALHLQPGEGRVVAYKDAASGLEYLRRTSDVAGNGLTVDLRAYQYCVFQEWRELQSTEEQPWDRLADGLRGAGVYSVDQALSMLRLRPVHEALRQMLSAEVLRGVAAAAYEVAGTEAESIGLFEDPIGNPFKDLIGTPVEDLIGTLVEDSAEAEPVSPLQDSGKALPVSLDRSSAASPIEVAKDAPTADVPEDSHADALSTGNEDPVLATAAELDDRIALFVERAAHLLALAGTPGDSPRKNITEAVLAATRIVLPDPVDGATWAEAFGRMLPDASADEVDPALWAPVLAWSVLRHLEASSALDNGAAPIKGKAPVTGRALAAFDSLQLRAALAETFSSLGMEGERAWRAAARVRLLLQPRVENAADLNDVFADPSFWDHADVRWLTEVNTSDSKTYLQKESFEELVAWMSLAHEKSGLESTGPEKDELSSLLLVADQSSYELAAMLAMFGAEYGTAPVSPADKPDRQHVIVGNPAVAGVSVDSPS